MKLCNLKEELLSNTFDIILLNTQEFNENEFEKLCNTLNKIRLFLKYEDNIDKEVVLKIYLCYSSINLTINEIMTSNKIEKDILNKLDNANSILDEFITDILFVNKKVEQI